LNIFEIVLLLAVALIVLGPERLPEVLQTVAKILRELRSASNTVLRELTEAADEPRRVMRELDPFQTGQSTPAKPDNPKPVESAPKP
jgi:Tat protein translocase TatB subunit